ncbi:MAG TPA: cytochrome c oxidase subunit 3 [Tepidisphaeraceae bacterium]|jgi:heme/copper-type cytochrome/quinol oxidase subunit 3
MPSRDDANSRSPDPFRDDDTPRQPSFKNPGTVGMILFLAALFMLFAASLLGYILIRLNKQSTIPLGSIALPRLLWLSTVLVIGVSVALGLATRQIRQGRHRSYRNALTAALALAAGFLTVQAPAMVRLLSEHQQLRATGLHLYGLLFFLVLLHAMHVLGGMVALVWVTVKAHGGAYDRPPPGHDPIRYTTLYWHFLDMVWIVMFSIFIVLR